MAKKNKKNKTSAAEKLSPVKVNPPVENPPPSTKQNTANESTGIEAAYAAYKEKNEALKKLYDEKSADLHELYKRKEEALIKSIEDKKKELEAAYSEKSLKLEALYEKNIAEKKEELEIAYTEETIKLQERYDEKEKSLNKTFDEKKEKFELAYSEETIKLQERYEEKEKSLNNTIAAKKAELDEQAHEIEERNLDLTRRIKEFEEEISHERQLIKSERERMVEDIKADEAQIRREYNLMLQAEWDEKYRKMQVDAMAEFEKIIAQAKKEREDAVTERLEAEKLQATALAEALEEVRQKMEENNSYHQARIQELLDKESRLAAARQDFENERENFELEKELVQNLKDHLNQLKEKFSPAVVERLEATITLLEGQKENLIEINKALVKENYTLKQFAENDEGKSISNLLTELELLRKDNIELRDRLADLPSESELTELRGIAEKADIIQEQLRNEQKRRQDSERKLSAYAISAIEFEQLKKINETLRILNTQLQDEITRNNEFYKQQETSRFPALIEIDESLDIQKRMYGTFIGTQTNKNLAQLVSYIRNYGAAIGDGENKLFYSSDTIRAFIASMASTRLIILQGLSGTGKSSLPRLLKKALGFGNSFISVQSSWRDNRELLGYDNDFTRKFKETEFTKELYAASSPINSNRVFLIVLDEMNLSRVEYYFADFLSVLEGPRDQWLVNLVEQNSEANPPKYLIDGKQLRITPNIWFVGTANRDESTQGITDKVYDRAQILDFTNRGDDFNAVCNEQISLSYGDFNALLNDAVNDPDYRMTKEDWEKIDHLDLTMKDALDITFGNRIKNQMEKFVPVYIACGGTKNEAIDFMLTYKVLRKLENRFEPYIVHGLTELEEAINQSFGNAVLISSRNFINKKKERLGGLL